MGSWEVKGAVTMNGKSWRDRFPEMAEKVERIKAPLNRGIAWEGTEIWAYKNRPDNVIEAFKSNVRKFPDKIAYYFHPSGVTMTWSEVSEKVNTMAYSLRSDYGFKKGDVLSLITLGGPEFIISYLAIVTLGGIAVPTNLGIAAEGIATQINTVHSKGIVVSTEMWNSKVKSIRNMLESVKNVFLIGDEQTDDCILFSSLVNKKVVEEVSEEMDEWDLCAISFTSGTTGAPKGTMTMHINAIGCSQVVGEVLQSESSEDIAICMPPLYHNTAVYANFLPALLLGHKLLVMEAFIPIEAIKLIEDQKATYGAAAPVMLWLMMNHPEFKNYDCSSFTKILFGGHAASKTFINQLKQEFSPTTIVNGGSVSESTAVGFALPTADAITKIASCGLATPNTEIALFDFDGTAITKPGEVGEVAYKGQQTNAGYWENPQKTKETFRKDGYVLSGDWAKIDEDGYLWLLDRKKDMIVRGGQNVYCIEIENILFMHEKVLGAAVVGVPDNVFSERVKAVVVAKPGQTITPEMITEHCAKRLAPYEVPEYVVIAPAIPTNPAGKTVKQPLIDLWGEAEGVSDPILEKFKAYCSSMPEKFLKIELLKTENRVYSPMNALHEIEVNSEDGKKLRSIIEHNGIVELLKPDESRFKQ